MRIDIRLDPSNLRGWQSEVVAGLKARPGFEIRLSRGNASARLPKASDTLFLLERMLFHAEHGALTNGVTWPDLPSSADVSWASDLLIDLCGDGVALDATPVLTIRCDGEALETGALVAVLDERDPRFETLLTVDGGRRVLSAWRPAVESPRSATASLGMLLGRAAHMLVRDASRLADGIPPGSGPVQNCDGLYGAALGFAEVRTLSPQAYAQTLSATALPWGDNTGLHTFNRSATLETIDLFGPRHGEAS